MKRFSLMALVALALVGAPGVSFASHCVSNDGCGSSGAGRCCRDASGVWCTSTGCSASPTYPGNVGVRNGGVCAENTNTINGTPVGPTLENLFPNCD